MKQQQPRSLGNLSCAVLLAALTLICLVSLPEADILFGIYHGQNILSGSPIVAPDTWNFQTAGEDWTSNSWLWDVVLGATYNAAGLVGVSLLNGACFAASLWLAWSICTRLEVTGARRILATITFALASITFFTARAVDVDILLLLAFARLLLMLQARLDGWKLVGASAVMALLVATLGMNLHLSASAFIVLFPAAFALLNSQLRWRLQLTALPSLALASFAGVLLTPYGINGITKAVAVADASRRYIVEWNGPNLDTSLGWIVLNVLLAGLAVAAVAIWRRRFASAVLILSLEVLAFEAVRFTIYVIVIALLVAIQLLASWRPRESIRFSRTNQRLILGAMAVIAAVCAAVVAFTYANPQRLMEVEPRDFAAFAPHSRVISTPSEGSAILFYRRDVQVAVDGRNDLLGAKRYINATNTFGYASGSKLRAWLDRYRVDGAYLTNQQEAELGPRFAALGWKAHPEVYGVAYTR